MPYRELEVLFVTGARHLPSLESKWLPFDNFPHYNSSLNYFQGTVLKDHIELTALWSIIMGLTQEGKYCTVSSICGIFKNMKLKSQF